MVYFRYFTGGLAALVGGDDDGSPVIVRTTYKESLFPGMTEITDIEVRRDIGTQVPDMAVSIGVRKSAGYQQR
ncbi:hypothetical protein MKMG_01605 [Methanogenium sp. MK-MG]|nr:hypothetical protein MKMG_01605 [Methanogenium sp. MK-MG]